LRVAGFRTHIETSGTHPLSGDWHHICFSPKKFKAPLPAYPRQQPRVEGDRVQQHDLAWGQQHADQVNTDCALFLQPEWSKRDTVTPLIVDHVKAHPRWRSRCRPTNT
jgi:7-carboxy-7-deazaguanine synthase